MDSIDVAARLRAALGCLLFAGLLLVAPAARAHGEGAAANGWSVTQVDYGQGRFAQVDGNHWREDAPDGQHVFEELQRDEWSVYLLDRSRDMRIQLDLFRKEVIVGEGNSRRPIYTIVDAHADGMARAVAIAPTPVAPGAKGTNATHVDYDGGTFAMHGPGRWRERNAGGAHEFEETGRDEWSVYLTDRSRNLGIQLDLHRREVILDERGARRVLYAIRNARAEGIPQPVAVVVAPRPVVMPATLGAKGTNATHVGYDGGTFSMQGPGRWLERNAGGAHEFEETGRDEWSVYLADRSRNLGIQLDLSREEVILDERGARRALYAIRNARADGIPQAVAVVQPVQPTLPPLVGASRVLTGPYIDPSITGYNASSVTYNKDGRTLGLVVTQGGGHWREIAMQGGGQNAFEETGRDATSVYLFDPSRNVRLQLDLANKKVMYGEGQVVSMRPLYDIHSARADPLTATGFAGGQARPVVDPVQPVIAVVDTNQDAGVVRETLPSSRGPSTANKEFCWKDSIPRGVGTIPQSCGPGREMLGALCYSQCGANRARFGLDCHSVCPDGMRDDGLFCRAAEYTRGAGYGLIPIVEWSEDGMRSRCEADHGRGQCELSGAVYYPKCRTGYSGYAFVCRPNAPDCGALGMNPGIDLSCAKVVAIGDPSVGTCAAGEEEDAGLCYRQCEPGYDGVGPVCWAGAPPGWTQCGMGAAKDDVTCASIVVGQVQTVGQLAFNIASLGSGTAASKAASTAGKAGQLGELKQRYEQLKRLYEQARPAIEAAMQAKAAAGAAVDTVELMDEEVVTEADILRISAQIAAIADPTGVADTVAAYSYPKCSAYGF